MADSYLSRVSPIHRFVWWILLVASVLPLSLCKITTSDLWWHLYYGRYFASHWQSPDFSESYFTPVAAHVSDFRWTFLGDLIFYGAYSLGGTYAIQGLVLLVVLAAMLLILSLQGWRYDWSTLLLLVAFVFGTYQLQLHRNAVFSLVFVVCLLWLFQRAHSSSASWRLWLCPPFIGLWSTIHGSYLLGFVLLCLLLAGDALDTLLARDRRARRKWIHYMGVVLVTFACITAWNPLTTRMLTQPFRFAMKNSPRSAPEQTPASTTNHRGLLSGAPAETSSSIAPPLANAAVTTSRSEKVKKWLNNTLWPEVASEPRSGDFSSPFDELEFRPVVVSFLFGVVGMIHLFFFTRPLRLALILPLGAVIFAGMCYLRLTGYISIVSACAMAMNSKGNAAPSLLHARLASRLAMLICGVWFCFLYGALLRGTLPELLGTPAHVFGFGKSPIYDDRFCDYVKKATSGAEVFTTIVSGSFALFTWSPDKKVFVDGFFAPHRSGVWRDYVAVRQLQNPDLLHQQYGSDYALVEMDRTDWNTLFLYSHSWQPVALGLGEILYCYQPKRSSVAPNLLFDFAGARDLPRHFGHALAVNYYASILSVIHFTQDGGQTVRENRDIFFGLESYLEPTEEPLFQEAAKHVMWE